MPVPAEQILDGLKMSADAEIDLFELTPAAGGTIRFKNDNDVTYLSNLYSGIPLELSGEGRDSDKGFSQPTLVIGQPNIDLSAFKPLIYNGGLDGAIIQKHTVLLTHLLANQNLKKIVIYRVKRVENYSSSVISMVLSTFSPAGPSVLPFRQFVPPAFPFVRLT